VSRRDLVVPDLGNFDSVPVVDVLVKPGDTVEVDAPLVTLETDKASMDVPSAAAGTIAEVLVKKGDKVSKGTVLARLDTAATESPPVEPKSQTVSDGLRRSETAASSEPVVAASGTKSRISDEPADRDTQLLVLGAGPGGYTAAFRAADLGLKVTLVERWATLGGVCLNVGCIPSKALLHAARVIEEAEAMGVNGLAFGSPAIDLERLRGWKSKVVGRLTGGLATLAKQRKVEVARGEGRFVSPHVVEVRNEGRSERIRFEQCIIAAGSESVRLPGLPDDPRIMDSTGALELPEFDGQLLIVGGGIIGLEMACVYDAMGSHVSVVELMPQLMPGTDPDLVRPLEKRIRERYERVMLETKVRGVEARSDGLRVAFEGKNAPPEPQTYSRVLVAVGRRPNGREIGAEAAGVEVSDRGFVKADRQMRTNVPHIFAIGDVVGQPMLAHKAMHEGKVAAEVAAGKKAAFEARVIPSVAYTDPEIAWVGLTETDAKANGTKYGKGTFPWAASARSLTMTRDDGMTKLLFDPDTHRVLGGGLVGPNAGELVAEIALAIEMGADAADIGLTIHPHPTLTETVALSAEAFEGTITDLMPPRKKA
jgi:dihydrolipoamide dehydrogenase